MSDDEITLTSPTTGRRILWEDEDGLWATADDLTLAEAREIQAFHRSRGSEPFGSPGFLVAMSRMRRFTESDYDG